MNNLHQSREFDPLDVDVDRIVREQLLALVPPITAIIVVAGVVIVRVLPLVLAWQAQFAALLGH
jgi:hypothetical protein